MMDKGSREASLLSVALAAWDPGYKLRTVRADDTEPKSRSHVRTAERARTITNSPIPFQANQENIWADSFQI